MNGNEHCYVCEHDLAYSGLLECGCICHDKYINSEFEPWRLTIKCLMDYPAMSDKQAIYDDVRIGLQSKGILVKEIIAEQL